MLRMCLEGIASRLYHDQRGIMAAEYALMLALACGCLAVLSFHLGGSVSHSISHVAEIISGEVELIRRGHYD